MNFPKGNYHEVLSFFYNFRCSLSHKFVRKLKISATLMKTLIIISALSIACQFSFGQGLKKDNLFGVHVITVSVKPGASIEEFKGFFVKEVLPEYEKHW